MDSAIASLPEEHEATDELRHARGSAMRATDLTKRLLTFSRQKVSAPLLVDVRDIVRGMQPLLVRTLGEQVKLDLRPRPRACNGARRSESASSRSC